MINNVLDKVKGLLSKTVEAGATHEEAASAANVAQQLITKYRLEIAELDSDDDEISAHKLPLFAGQRIITWRSDLAYWICEFNGCRPIYRKHKDQVVLTIIGRPGDVAIVRYLFDILLVPLKFLLFYHLILNLSTLVFLYSTRLILVHFCISNTDTNVRVLYGHNWFPKYDLHFYGRACCIIPKFPIMISPFFY